MKKFIAGGASLAFAFGILLLLPLSAFALTTPCYTMDEGCSAQVVYVGKTCSYDLAEDSGDNYYVFSSYSGNVSLGDVIFGEWDSYVNTTMFNFSRSNYPTLTIYVAAPEVSSYNYVRTYLNLCPNA